MIDNLSITFHNLLGHMLTSLSVNKMLLPRYVNWSSNSRSFPLKVEMAPSCLKHMNFVLFAFSEKSIPPVPFSRLCNFLKYVILLSKSVVHYFKYFFILWSNNNYLKMKTISKTTQNNAIRINYVKVKIDNS